MPPLDPSLIGRKLQHINLQKKKLAKNLEKVISLPHIFNVKNSMHRMKDLQEILFKKDLKFVSFDTTDMYTNMPTQELMEIIENMWKQNGLDKIIYKEIAKTCNLIITQNYFQYKNTQYIQEQGLAMGAPTSSIFSEIYLQHLENTKIFNILRDHQLIGYFRYMDNILLVYKNGLKNIHEILKLFNNISPTLTFTMEKELNNSINFLDITICKTNHDISLNIYRKPTASDTVIPNDSGHPLEHKMAAIRYLTNRLVTYPMNNTNKKKEYHTVKQTLLNNKYDAKILDKIISTKNTEIQEQKEQVNTTTYTKPTTK